MRAKPRRSLQSRALQLLAQRDQSRVELRRKLLRHAKLEAAALANDRGEAPTSEDSVRSSEPEREPDPAPEREVDALLAWLDGHGFLDEARFVESRVHARQSRFGNLRIGSELAQHGLAAPADLVRSLAESELDRAAVVRERRFAEPPADAAGRAAQSRFLAGRGFSPDAIHRLMRRLAGRERES